MRPEMPLVAICLWGRLGARALHEGALEGASLFVRGE